MVSIQKGIAAFTILLLIGCSGKTDKKKETIKIGTKIEQKIEKKAKKTPASKTIDLSNKGIGPITSIQLPDKTNTKMVNHGADVFKKLCTACHRTDKKFIGPALLNITQRRSPEWIMNMIMNPYEMVQKDSIAKDLLAEFNGAPMPNQNVSEKDARALLEYFRTLK